MTLEGDSLKLDLMTCFINAKLFKNVFSFFTFDDLLAFLLNQAILCPLFI